MKKIEMVEEVTYFCDICGIDITNIYLAHKENICNICGREHCEDCLEVVQGHKEMLISICSTCYDTYEKFKTQMNECHRKYDGLERQEIIEIKDRWKKESLLVKNKGE